MALYDPAKVSMLINGKAIQGVVKGTFFEVEFNEDRTSMDIGAKGDGTVALSHDRSATWKCTIKNDSPSSYYLDLMAKLHDQGESFTAVLVGPFGGRISEETYIKKVATLGYSDGPDDSQEWEFNSPYTQTTMDGLESIGAALQEGINTLLGALT